MKIFYFGLALLSIILISCADENPDLVSPPSQAETMYIRFLNFSVDKKDRYILMDDSLKTDITPFGQSSAAIHPPSDSSFVTLMQGSQKDWKSKQRDLYTRNGVYTYVALSPPWGSPADTLEVKTVTISTFLKKDDIRARIKVLNAYPDSTSTFSINWGCPNGNALVSNAAYKSTSPNKEVDPGEYALSITHNKKEGTNNFLGTYKVDLDTTKQYCIVIHDDGTKNPTIKLLHQDDQSLNAMRPMELINSTTTSIRSVNLTSKDIYFRKNSEEWIANPLGANTIGAYEDIQACGSIYPDTLWAMDNPTADTSANVLSSLEVLRKYTLLAYDDDKTDFGYNVRIVKPAKIYESLGTRSLIRVFHAASNYENLMITIGARTNNDLPNNYESGVSLAPDIAYSEMSEPILVQSGQLPLIIFTSEDREKLLYNTLENVEEGKSYLLIISNHPDDNLKLTLVEDETELEPVQYSEKGVLALIINAMHTEDFKLFSMAPVLEDAKLYYEQSIATVIPAGNHDLEFKNSATLNYNAVLDENLLLIGYTSEQEDRAVYYSNPSLGAGLSDYKRRVINLSSTYSEVYIHDGDVHDPPLVAQYQVPSDVLTFYKERKKSIAFAIDNTTHEEFEYDTLYKFDNEFSFGKNYTIIFTADSLDTEDGKVYKSTAILQQEF